MSKSTYRNETLNKGCFKALRSWNDSATVDFVSLTNSTSLIANTYHLFRDGLVQRSDGDFYGTTFGLFREHAISQVAAVQIDAGMENDDGNERR